MPSCPLCTEDEVIILRAKFTEALANADDWQSRCYREFVARESAEQRIAELEATLRGAKAAFEEGSYFNLALMFGHKPNLDDAVPMLTCGHWADRPLPDSDDMHWCVRCRSNRHERGWAEHAD